MNNPKKIILFLAIICIGKSSFAQFTGSNPITQSTAGNVGINIISPSPVIAPLEVKNGSVLFDGTIGTYPALSGAGTRMLWYPAKKAFRAGSVTGAQWDDASIGTNSFASGNSTTASGTTSTAMGNGTIASGLFSFACGNTTTASGPYGFASGVSTLASANFTFAAGSQTIASASGASVFGNYSTASGILSTAFGYHSIAQAYSSFVIGAYNNTSLGYNTNAWINVDPLFVIGNGTSSTATNNALTVLKNGNVLINKATQTNTGYILDVNGKIRSNEIVVNTTGADFVFEKNYKLTPLNLLEQMIKEEKHLPGIASASEMQENGVGLAELNKSLLQKTEELTLYIIELNKRIELLEQKLNNK